MLSHINAPISSINGANFCFFYVIKFKFALKFQKINMFYNNENYFCGYYAFFCYFLWVVVKKQHVYGIKGCV
ncbi:hypothetical protein BV912_00215 [Neisseria dumasiana]|uniref:Uncharacterized protein n=1 Tax=Neisseria dumasiana TaxID=1931275 RepID=A0A1X3DL97_9NEIS|nr:hypothetical protein BV912_00215 [Neisseria dumasiana]